MNGAVGLLISNTQ